MSCELESCTCNNESTIGEGGDGRPPHKIHITRKRPEPCLVSATLEVMYATHKRLNACIEIR